jgi:signal transduction histidine kinase/CheY-like chemotaxis protein
MSGLFRRLPIHRKLMALLMITSGVALLLAAVMSIMYAYFQVRDDMVVSLGASATLVFENTRPAVRFEDPLTAQESLATLRANPSIQLACLYRATGELFADYRPIAGRECPRSPPAAGNRFTTTYLELVQRDTESGKPAEWLLLQSHLDLLFARLRSQATITAFGLLGALAVAFLLSASLQRIVLQPITELADLTSTVSATGDYSRRAVKRSDDELGVLAESVNRMLERIRRVEEEREGALAREREANRAKDEFLATLSHELRTPLSAILGWTQLLRRHALPADELEHSLERIERNAHAQNRLINDLLDVSRILSGKLSLHRQSVDLAPVTRTIVDSMVPLAQARQITLTADIAKAPLPAFIDADRIHQVVTNLLSNALKFTPPGGTVTVALRSTGEMAELTVADTGAGITAEFLPRVFEPFRQADSSHTRAHGGLGLGLAIVKRITEMHGGDVTVRSDGVGLGATFSVRLPAAPGEFQAGVTPAGRAVVRSSPDLSRYSVLVVDDDSDTRDLVLAAVAPTGARLSGAASVAEAVDAAVRRPPDVLITDIAMPVQDGYALIEQLREALNGRMPAVLIALTAFASEADTQHSLAVGFDVHLTKPFDPDLLVATIHERLNAPTVQEPDSPPSDATQPRA